MNLREFERNGTRESEEEETQSQSPVPLFSTSRGVSATMRGVASKTEEVGSPTSFYCKVSIPDQRGLGGEGLTPGNSRTHKAGMARRCSGNQQQNTGGLPSLNAATKDHGIFFVSLSVVNTL